MILVGSIALWYIREGGGAAGGVDWSLSKLMVACMMLKIRMVYGIRSTAAFTD